MRVADTLIAWRDAARQTAFERWIDSVAPRHGLELASLMPASADASFRRYLRVATADGGSLIVMDAPPPQEDVRPFVHVAGLTDAAGLHAPRVLEADVDHGFLLLTDLGRTPYLEALLAAGEAEADRLMRDALAALLCWQHGVPAAALPPFDARLAGARAGAVPRMVRAARVRHLAGPTPSAPPGRASAVC